MNKPLPEITLRVIVLSIFLTLILGMANAYLALKIGILTSASIPAAILSMCILRFFKDASILENNLVQTAASAGEAIAGGIVYTIPALIIIQYWTHFDYFENFLIAFIGGSFGVFFSIPLRKILLHDKSLKFPEGVAVAEVLKADSSASGRGILLGGLAGSLIEFLQSGLKLLKSDWQMSLSAKKICFSLGLGFSPTMIGAGFLIGFEMALSIFIGAILMALLALPLCSALFSHEIASLTVSEAVNFLASHKVRYIGIGAMLFAGIWTFFSLLKPLALGLATGVKLLFTRDEIKLDEPDRVERDLPFVLNFVVIIILSALLLLSFNYFFPLAELGFNPMNSAIILGASLLYILVIGFLFSAITGYFSGMVGVSASPGSSIIIAGMLIVASLLFYAMKVFIGGHFSAHQLQMAEAITIIIGSVVTGIAAIANDNMQDLKVGQLVGSTPWKQQVMLLLGVLVSALIIPKVMQLLFDVYGIAGVMPRENMDASLSLPAPPAALMAAITEGVFRQDLPWNLLLLGCGLGLFIVILSALLKKYVHLSVLGVAIGLYLPVSSSIPLFIGGLMAWLIKRALLKQTKDSRRVKAAFHQSVLIACGMVAGAAIMDVLLAIPFSIFGSSDVLIISGISQSVLALPLSILVTFGLFIWFKRAAKQC